MGGHSKPIRTLAQVPLSFSLLELYPPFIYQHLAVKASELRSLGMSVFAIARALGVTEHAYTSVFIVIDPGNPGDWLQLVLLLVG